MSDERALKTAKAAEAAYVTARASLGKMLQEETVVFGWLRDTREIVVEWLMAACQVKFRVDVLGQLWRPLGEGGFDANRLACGGVEEDMLMRIKAVAGILGYARFQAEGKSDDQFARRLLAAVQVLGIIDTALADLGRNALNAIKCIEQIPALLHEIGDVPNAYPEEAAA